MFQINHEAFVTEVNNRKHRHVELKLLQTNWCTIGGPLSVLFSDIYVTKAEEEVVKPTNPGFYKRFVDDIISKKKKDQPDLLFENLNNHHPNIKYTTETMPQTMPSHKHYL